MLTKDWKENKLVPLEGEKRVREEMLEQGGGDAHKALTEGKGKVRRPRGERAAAREAAALLVGRAFRCPDGLVRWITGFSSRDYFSLLWLDERSDTWFSGGIVKMHKWLGWYGDAEEVRAPQPGETYKLAGPTGMVDERKVAEQS